MHDLNSSNDNNEGDIGTSNQGEETVQIFPGELAQDDLDAKSLKLEREVHKVSEDGGCDCIMVGKAQEPST